MCLIFIFLEHPYNEVIESDKYVVCDGSCSECELRLNCNLSLFARRPQLEINVRQMTSDVADVGFVCFEHPLANSGR